MSSSKFTEAQILSSLSSQLKAEDDWIERDRIESNIQAIKRKEKPQHRRKVEPVERMTSLEKRFLLLWEAVGGNQLDWLFGQKIFAERPRMHVDFYNAEWKIAVEIDGGQWQKSGHSSGNGLQRDAVKLALCNRIGVKLYRLPTSMVCFEEVEKLYKEINQCKSVT